MAPGGDTSADLNGDQFADGVLSLGLNDGDGQFNFVFLQGTSMASPHVAGVVSLMKGLRPELTAQQAVTILRNTARPLSATECKRSSAGDCGAGLVDAAAAVLGVDGNLPGTGPLAFQPDPVDFGTTSELLTLILTNTTTASESWSLVGFDPSPSNPTSVPDGTVFVPSGVVSNGTLAGSAGTQMVLGLDRSKVSVQGLYSVQLVFDVGGQEQRLQARFSTLPSGGVLPDGPTVVAAFIEGVDGELEIVASQEQGGFFSDYRLETVAGENMILAWSDQNRSEAIDDGDYFGVYPLVVVNEGQSVKGIDIPFQPLLGTGATSVVVDPAIARALHSLRAVK
jgi:serine protease